MRTPVCLILISIVALVAACAHVDANYPDVAPLTTRKALPAKHWFRKKPARLLWQEPGEIHGFETLWESAGDMALRMQRAADGRNAAASKDHRRFERMDERGLCFLGLWVFAARDVELLLRRGDLRIHFTDGTSTVNKDLFLYPVVSSLDPFQSTAVGTVLLSGNADPDLEGRHFYVFMEEEWLAKKVARVEFIKG